MPLPPLNRHQRLLLGNLGDDTEGLALADLGLIADGASRRRLLNGRATLTLRSSLAWAKRSWWISISSG
jgi:hypothetical protein